MLPDPAGASAVPFDFAASSDAKHRPSSIHVPNYKGNKKEAKERVDLTDYSVALTMTGIFPELDLLRMPSPFGPHQPAMN